MEIIVCIKQVPGTNSVEIDPITGVLKRDGVESKMNPYDLYAVETALSLCEKYGGGVRVLTMGPPQAVQAVMEAVRMGADSGYVITDHRFAGADVLATSRAISESIKHIAKTGGYDLILCGKQTTDGDTAQVGPEIAELLDIPHVTNVTEVQVAENNSIRVRANLDRLIYVFGIKTPCLLCMESGVNTPRLPSFKRSRMFGDENVVTYLSLSDFEDSNASLYGLNGSPTQVEKIFPPDKSSTKDVLEGDPRQLADALYEQLVGKKFVSAGG